jgi:hypothetical protein
MNEVKPSKHNFSDHVNTIQPTGVDGGWGAAGEVQWAAKLIFQMKTDLLLSNFKLLSQTDVVYGCETWWLIMREQRMLMEFQNMDVRTFGPNMEITKEWRRLHKEELNDPYSSQNIVRVIKSKIMRGRERGHVCGDRTGAYWTSVGKPEGKRLVGRPRSRGKDNIKMDHQEMGGGGV